MLLVVFSQVVAVHDVTSIYRVPLLLENQGVVSFLKERLKLPTSSNTYCLRKWKNLADRSVLVGERDTISGVQSRIGEIYVCVSVYMDVGMSFCSLTFSSAGSEFHQEL